MGLLLWIISKLITIFLLPLGILVGIICDLIKYPLSIASTKAMARFRAMAVATDIYGNVACPELLQFLFTKGNDYYLFGTEGETVSYVIGMNKDLNKLNAAGRLLCKILLYFKDPLNT